MKRLLIALSAIIIMMNINVLGQDAEHLMPYCLHCPPDNIKDWGLIFQGTVSKKLSSNFKTEFNVQTRIMDQFSSVKTIMFEPGIKVKLANHFALKSAFRYSLLPNQYPNDKQRVHLAGYYVWHKEGVPLRIQYRTRVEKEDFFFWRNRIKVALNFRQLLKPYSSFETFNQSGNLKSMDLYRYEGGIKWEMHEAYNVTFMYRQEVNYGDFAISKTRVFGLMLNHSL